jgi:hypothetical protein
MTVKSRTLKRLTTNIVDGQSQFGSNYTQTEVALLKKATFRASSPKIEGEVVYGGNNIVCCMMYKRSRCFGGHKVSRLVVAFFLINVPGVIFQAVILP